jgi:hypothetical protein
MALFGSPIKLVAAYLYGLQQCNSLEGSINTQSAATSALFGRTDEGKTSSQLPVLVAVPRAGYWVRDRDFAEALDPVTPPPPSP